MGKNIGIGNGEEKGKREIFSFCGIWHILKYYFQKLLKLFFDIRLKLDNFKIGPFA